MREVPRGGVDAAGYYRPSTEEVLTCWVGGVEPVDPITPSGLSPRAGFEAALLPALRRPPCVIAFSGGRDSSAVLAVATGLARREGLPDPVAATHDFGGRGDTDETRFQELLVAELGLREWHRFRDVEAFDVLGARARAGLRRHGLLWPAMVHCHAPLVELAAGGGSLVTGEGGDEILGNQRMTALTWAVQNRYPPGRRTRALLADSLAPAVVRRRRLRARLGATPMLPWLRGGLAEAFVDGLVGDLAGAPLRWDAAVRRHRGRRAVTTAARNFRRVLAADDVSFHEPFLDPAFVGPFSRAGGIRGFTTRTSMMRMLFGDVVPDVICRRNEKASFGAVAVGGPSREFLAGWTGAGVDPDLVDVAALRAAALSDSPPYGVQLLLQAAWLATVTDREPARG
ncbi:MAG: asparagine synthase-related protein [Pseudonocardia sp.]